MYRLPKREDLFRGQWFRITQCKNDPSPFLVHTRIHNILVPACMSSSSKVPPGLHPAPKTPAPPRKAARTHPWDSEACPFCQQTIYKLNIIERELKFDWNTQTNAWDFLRGLPFYTILAGQSALYIGRTLSIPSGATWYWHISTMIYADGTYYFVLSLTTYSREKTKRNKRDRSSR